MDYSIQMDAFEGPLDLLLELIKKKELDVYDLPISRITTDYLAYLSHMETRQIELTSDFAEMAGVLLHMKAKLLIPKEAEKEDPRNELVQQLIDFQAYKEAVQKMEELKEIERKFFKREKVESVQKKKKVTIEEMIRRYQEIMRRKKETNHSRIDALTKQLTSVQFHIEDQMVHIQTLITSSPEGLEVKDLFDGMRSSEEAVVTFGALLELVKTQAVELTKDDHGHIYLHAKGKE